MTESAKTVFEPAKILNGDEEKSTLLTVSVKMVARKYGEKATGEARNGEAPANLSSAEPKRLVVALVHKPRAHDAVREPREVLDIGCCCQLAAGGNIVSHPSLEQNRLEFTTGGVVGGRVGSGAAVGEESLWPWEEVCSGGVEQRGRELSLNKVL
ncbi:hypothetical protein V6N12_021901 [Hibiscus sabdariffa]|uniref:Uncharacterized protein n=1 Tax=Hibiscus sabdariffa TaxID=183260 RepID=A0ABR2FTA4_9ROSI